MDQQRAVSSELPAEGPGKQTPEERAANAWTGQYPEEDGVPGTGTVPDSPRPERDPRSRQDRTGNRRKEPYPEGLPETTLNPDIGPTS